MDKDFFTEHRNRGHMRLRQMTWLLREEAPSEGSVLTFCIACLLAGLTRPAIGHTSHPEYRRVALCAECIAYYDREIGE